MSADELSRRVKTLEESFQTLVELAQNHDSQMDDLRATMNSLGERVVILTDAQIRTEDRMHQLTDSQRKLTDSQRKLADSQRILTESQRELTDSQRGLADFQRGLADSQRKLADAQRELADSQQHTDERLNALIDIVIQSRKDDDVGRSE